MVTFTEEILNGRKTSFFVQWLKGGNVASPWSLFLWGTKGIEYSMNIHTAVILLFVLELQQQLHLILSKNNSHASAKIYFQFIFSYSLMFCSSLWRHKLGNKQLLPDISRGNQIMNFGQLIEYNVRNIFLQKSCRKWERETSSRALFFKKSFMWGKSKWSPP